RSLTTCDANSGRPSAPRSARAGSTPARSSRPEDEMGPARVTGTSSAAQLWADAPPIGAPSASGDGFSTIRGMRMSVLDQSPISEGSDGAEALRNTIDLAQLADSLGYHRYWVAEHHGGPMLASASPEALIGPIAAATSEIRVGSGGVMLPHYSPLK